MRKEDLHPYQLKAVEHILRHRGCALFLDMGLGKTVSTLTAIDTLVYDELDVSKVLVIAPKRVAESVWDAEIDKWDHLKRLRISKVVGDLKQRVDALHKEADIYVIGRDNVAWLASVMPKTASRFPFDMLVIDELSSFKNPKSQRFKHLKKMRPFFRRIVGLTGTPAPNGLMDLWSQVFLLDGGKRLFPTLSAYRLAFFRPGMTNGHVVYNYRLLPGADRIIFSRIEDICMSMKAEDYLTLPPLMLNTIKIPMPQKLKDQYKEFSREQVLTIGSEEITATNAAVLANKLLQFADGAVYDEGGASHEIHRLKIDALKELVESSNGEPVLVAWTFRSDRDRILDALAEYNPVNLDTTQDIIDWNAGKIQVLLMHPASGGHGLNLQAGGHTIVWFGQTWNLELYQQLNARLFRQGQQKPVVIHHLVLEGTMDEAVMKAISRKTDCQDALIDAVKAQVEKYLSAN